MPLEKSQTGKSFEVLDIGTVACKESYHSISFGYFNSWKDF